NTRCFALYENVAPAPSPAQEPPRAAVLHFFLVPKLLLGNANFTPSSAWGHLCITRSLLIARDIFCQAGAWQARWFPSRSLGTRIHGGQCPPYISSDLRRLQDKNGF